MNRARSALDNVQSTPTVAIGQARAILADSSATDEERATALWAMGRAASELDDVERATASLEDGLAIALAAGLAALASDIRVSLSVLRLTGGDTAGARALLDEAEADASAGGPRGRLVMQRGLVDLHVGDLEAAIAHLDAALPHLADGGDEMARARLLINRGVALIVSGELDRGEADCLGARELADRLGQRMISAGAAQNLGFVADRKGDLPAALAWFDEARAGYAALGSPRRVMVTLETDHGSVLLNGGLYAEAAAAAERAAALAGAAGNRLAEGEAVLLLARARLAEGDHAGAERHATAAADHFEHCDRRSWVAAAEYIGLQAAAARIATPDEVLLDRAVTIADALDASGRRREALEVRTFAGRTALALGRADTARHQLTLAAAARDSGSSSVRADAWLAAASLHLVDGDKPAAARALARGMDIVEERRSMLGSTELRAHASINASGLAELGLRLAFDDDSPAEVLRWAERWHAGAIRQPPEQPRPGSRLAEALVELRQAHADAAAGPSDPFDDDGVDGTIARLERQIRHLSRQVATNGGGPDHGGPVDAEALGALLGEDLLVELVVVGSELRAVTVTADRLQTHRLASTDLVADLVDKAGSALARLAYGRSPDRVRQATSRALADSASRLDELLLAPLDLPPDVRVVVVPTGPLQRLPFALLPRLADRPVTVTPSASVWAAGAVPADGRHGARARTVLACGTALPGGEREVDDLRSLYPDPTVLVGSAATVPAVAGAMEWADIVHLAAHGRFRHDNPMFSSLALHDGPLTVYDIESLRSAPRTVILSACDAARASVHRGDELLGTAASLLQVGVRTVVAPMTVVPDARAVPRLMVELHRRLVAGDRPDEALVRARQVLVAEFDALDMAVAAAFVAIGTHLPRVSS
ncbi:MAG: CHAT domain-containing protein [Acidimicrobiales bacterium]